MRQERNILSRKSRKKFFKHKKLHLQFSAHRSTSDHNRMVQEAIISEIVNQPNSKIKAETARGTVHIYKCTMYIMPFCVSV